MIIFDNTDKKPLERAIESKNRIKYYLAFMSGMKYNNILFWENKFLLPRDSHSGFETSNNFIKIDVKVGQNI